MNKTLTPKQLKAAHYISQGHTYAEVSKLVGCNTKTLFQWRTEKPQFQIYLNELITQSESLNIESIKILQKEAINVIRAGLNSENAKHALACAVEILNRSANLAPVSINVSIPEATKRQAWDEIIKKLESGELSC